MALKMKGVDTYEYIEEDLKDKSPFMEIQKMVPVLVHNGEAIVGSIPIIHYIDNAFLPAAGSILPQDQSDTALINSIDDEIISPLWYTYWKEGEVRETAKKKAIEGLTILETRIKDKGKKFFGGDEIGMLDAVACFIAYGLPLLEELTKVKLLTPDDFPCLLKWVEDYYNDPLTKEHFPVNGALAKEYFPPKDPLSASYEVGLQTKDRYAFYKDAFLKTQP